VLSVTLIAVYSDCLDEQVTGKRVQLGESLATCPVARAQPFDLADDQTGLLEHPEVLGDGGLGKRQLVYELPAVAGIPREKQAQNPNTRRMTERLGEQRQVFVASNNIRSVCNCVHRTAAEWWRREEAMPAGTPRSDFTCGMWWGQPNVVPTSR